jgi:hypothetical protein
MQATPLALLATFATLALAAAPATAQEASDEMLPGDDGAAAPGDDDAFLAGEQTEEQQALAPPAAEPGTGLAEDPTTPYFSVGPRLRWIMMPSWFIGMFGVDIKQADHLLVNTAGVGAEFTYRKDSFDITTAIWWAGLGWDGRISFKESGEDANSWEVVQNSMSTVLISGDFIWSTPITDWFAITYGAGIGIGIPIGEIRRDEARTDIDPVGTVPCDGPHENQIPPDGCNPGEEFNEVYKIPTGIVPWINFLAGMRFKPHRHVAIYVDTGFGIGFQLGLRGGYIF